MPKGDRFKLKADPEDGTTPIANLLLEAVAMAKISGLQKGAILYLWRRTYGWVEDGKRLKERKIALSEWQHALDSTKPRVSATLAELEHKQIIKRRMADAWGGYYYAINTNVASWNSNCLNIAKLSEMIIVTNFGTVTEKDTVTQSDNSCEIDNSSPKKNGTVTENVTEQLPKTQLPTLYKERLKKDKERGDVKITSPIGLKTKEVFFRLDKIRGYRPPKRQAEAAAIIRMLKKDYTPDQIVESWEKLKGDNFWADKELFMMTIESQIGAKLKNGTHQGSTQKPRALPTKYTTPEEWRAKGK